MNSIKLSGSDNPDGLIQLVNSLPSEFNDDFYEIVFPKGYLYRTLFPVIATWAKRAPRDIGFKLNLDELQESARRLVTNVGLPDIVEDGLEAPRQVLNGVSSAPLQPVVVGSSTVQVIERIYHMVDDWAGYQQDTAAFKTILSELAENVLVHSEASSPGYVHARVHHGGQGDKCEITFADSGIGILQTYLEGTNEDVKMRLAKGASAIRIAVDGLNSSKPRDISPGGRSYFGYGLYTVKRLIEINRGRMTVISGNQYLTLDRYRAETGELSQPWVGTIVALVIELANPLPLEDVYEEEVERYVSEENGREQTAQSASGLTHSPSATPPIAITKGLDHSERQTLIVRNFSTQLLARETGLAIRAELALLLVDGATVEVDLDGVEDMTPSVADECFGKLAERMGDAKFRSRIIFSGGVPLLYRLIDFVVANRLKIRSSESES